MRNGEDLPVTLGFVDGLKEQIDSFGLRLVGAHAGEPHQRPRALPAGSQLCDHVMELRLRPRRIPRLEVQVGSVNASAEDVLRAASGRQLARPVEQESSCSRRAASSGMTRRVLEGGSDDFVRLLGGGGQMSSLRLWVLDQFRQPRVHLCPTKRIRCLVCARREQRVGESDPISLELDDPRLERRRKAGAAGHSRSCLDQRHTRMRESRRPEQEVATLLRERL